VKGTRGSSQEEGYRKVRTCWRTMSASRRVMITRKTKASKEVAGSARKGKEALKRGGFLYRSVRDLGIFISKKRRRAICGGDRKACGRNAYGRRTSRKKKEVSER